MDNKKIQTSLEIAQAVLFIKMLVVSLIINENFEGELARVLICIPFLFSFFYVMDAIGGAKKYIYETRKGKNETKPKQFGFKGRKRMG